MTDHSAGTAAGIVTATGTKLEPNAIGATQDTIIGMASSAPAATVGSVAGGPGGGDRLRQRADPDPDRHPDAHHR